MGASFYYYSVPDYTTRDITRNTKIALQPDPGWIAILDQSGGLLDGVLSIIDDSGLKLDGKPDPHLSGWYLAHFPEEGEQAELIGRLVEADGRDGIRDFYFAPVFVGRSGGRTIPGGSILVQWTGEPVPELLEESRPQDCEGGPEPVAMKSIRSVYRIHPGCHSGLALLDYANRLAESDETRFSEPDMIVGGMREPLEFVQPRGKAVGWPPGREKLTPSDSQFSNSWHWKNTGQEGGQPGMDVNITSAWDLTTGVEAVETAILDVGVEQNHPDINQKPGEDFTGQGSAGGGPNNTCDNHGTPVAGAVSAPINDQHTVGAAPATISRSARVFISEVDETCSGRWTTQFSWTVNALDWAFNQGIRVTNNSNSYDQPSSTIASKYQETHDLGMVHFASAGNDGTQGMNFPANLASVNAVSAVNRHGQRAAFSNFGSGLSLAAPGVEIYVPDRQGSSGYERCTRG